MKRQMIASFMVIALVAAVMGGATMAYFTAKADAPENEFVAGTVMIDAHDEVVYCGSDPTNVNPGDCFLKCIEIENTGSKAIELRLVDVGFNITIDWDWLDDHFDALCFSEDDFEDIDALHRAYTDGEFEIPVFIAPCPDSDWVMKYVKENGVITGFEFYYAGGKIEPGDSVDFCVVVVFDGEMMGNLWQGAIFEQWGGVFQAVQASNDAPEAVWGADWDPAWLAMDPDDALIAGTSGAYAAYFYHEGAFLFQDCCDCDIVFEPEDPQD